MHADLKANFLFGSRDPLMGPALHRLSTQKPHFLYEPLLRRVRRHEGSLRIPDCPDNRRHAIAQLRMAAKKAKRASSLSFVVAIVGLPLSPNHQNSPHKVE